jgi:hypothetical protein
MIRTIILIMCCFIIFFNNANAGIMYKCIDSDGNSTFTDMPQEGMKCDFKTDSLSDTKKFIITAKEFVKPKPGVEDYDITVEITHEKNNIYNVIAKFNQDNKSSHKVDAEEAFFFSGYVVKYFGLSKGFSGFDIFGTKFGRNEVKYSIVLNKTGSNLKQNDAFNASIRPEFLLSGK